MVETKNENTDIERKLDSALGRFSKLVEGFDDSIKTIQPVLFSELICRPIEINITDDKFYLKTKAFSSFFHLKYSLLIMIKQISTV